MTPDPIALPPELGVVEAAQWFLERKYHSYPVVDEGLLVGQISRRDILIALEDAWQWQNK
jgi:CBS domain-containing protein